MESSTNANDNPSMRLYPQMMQVSKVLIVNHNILRFHTYDLFKVLMLDIEFFRDALTKRPELEDFVREEDAVKSLRWAYERFDPAFCQDMFGDRDNYIKLWKSTFGDKRMHRTPTALTNSFQNIFYSGKTAGAVMWQEGADEVPSASGEAYRNFSTTNIFDVDALTEFITTAGFTGVFIDSVQMAATIAYNTSGVTFIIPSYRYNFDLRGQFMGMEHLTLAELNNKNEYGIFHPYNFVTARDATKGKQLEETTSGNKQEETR